MGALRIFLEAIEKPSTESVSISGWFYISLTKNLNKCYVLDKQRVFSKISLFSYSLMLFVFRQIPQPLSLMSRNIYYLSRFGFGQLEKGCNVRTESLIVLGETAQVESMDLE